jgi:hypothetical protein
MFAQNKIKKRIHKQIMKNKILKMIFFYYLFLKKKKKLIKTIIPNLKQQLNFCNNHSHTFFPKNSNRHKILIPWIATNHYSLYWILVIAKALQFRAAEIKFLYCNGTLDACERRSMHTGNINICRDCRLFQKHFLSIFKLETCELKDFINPNKIRSINDKAKDICKNYPDSYYYHGVDLIPVVNDSVIRFYYGGESESNDELTKLRTQHLATSMIGTEVAKNINEIYQPDIVLAEMFVYSAWQPYFDYYRKHKIKTVALNYTAYNIEALSINIMEYFYSTERFENYVDLRKEKPLDQNEKKTLEIFLKNRFSGNDLFFKKSAMFDNNIADEDIEKLLKIDRNKRNLFLFSNLFWDAGMDERAKNGLYNSVIKWVNSTIDLVKNDDRCHLYIKPHPAERFGSDKSSKGIVDYIFEKHPILPSNVSILFPELKINTYRLFPYVDLGIVFDGTLGLEMLLNNVPIVITGTPPYRGLGLCYEPRSVEEYQGILFGNDGNKINIDREKLLLFCYFFFIKGRVPFNIMKPIYGNANFEKYNFNSLDDLLPGKNYYLDHICDCILKNKIPENW